MRNKCQVLSVLLAFGAAGCGSSLPDTGPTWSCDVSQTSSALAGTGAVDCGFADVGEDPTAVWACAVDAFKAAHAFYVIVADVGIDTRILDAIVSDGTQIWALRQDQEDESPWRMGVSQFLTAPIMPAPRGTG